MSIKRNQSKSNLTESHVPAALLFLSLMSTSSWSIPLTSLWEDKGDSSVLWHLFPILHWQHTYTQESLLFEKSCLLADWRKVFLGKNWREIIIAETLKPTCLVSVIVRWSRGKANRFFAKWMGKKHETTDGVLTLFNSLPPRRRRLERRKERGWKKKSVEEVS